MHQLAHHVFTGRRLGFLIHPSGKHPLSIQEVRIEVYRAFYSINLIDYDRCSSVLLARNDSPAQHFQEEVRTGEIKIFGDTGAKLQPSFINTCPSFHTVAYI